MKIKKVKIQKTFRNKSLTFMPVMIGYMYKNTTKEKTLCQNTNNI